MKRGSECCSYGKLSLSGRVLADVAGSGFCSLVNWQQQFVSGVFHSVWMHTSWMRIVLSVVCFVFVLNDAYEMDANGLRRFTCCLFVLCFEGCIRNGCKVI